MPGSLTSGGLNFGRNLQLTITIGGAVFTINNLITEIGNRVLQTPHTEIPTNNDGIPVRDITYEGFEITLKISRQNGQIDALVFALYQNYINGGAKPTLSVSRTITNPNGSADQQIFTDGIIEIPNIGSYIGNSTVKDVEMKLTLSYGDDVGGAALPNLGTVASSL